MNALDIKKKLQAKGQSMTLTHTVAGTFDPVTGGMTGSSTVQTFAVYGIVTSYRDGVINQPGTLIQSGDKKAIVNAGTVTPVPGDNLTVYGVVWKVIAVDALEPTGAALLYKLQVRR